MTRSEKKFPAQTEWQKAISLRRTLMGRYGSDFAALTAELQSLTQLYGRRLQISPFQSPF